MTCIVGIRDGDTALVAFDSYVGTGNAATETTGPTKGLMLFPDVAAGFCGSVMFAQLVEHHLHLAAPVGDEREWMVREFVAGIRRLLNAHQAKIDSGTGVIVAVRGRVFEVTADLSVVEPAAGFAAIGAGGQFARGALWETRTGLTAEGRARRALEAAAALCAHVRPPFHVLRTRVAA